MKLVSKFNRNHQYAEGHVVEMPAKGKCFWVKIKEVDCVRQQVHLASAAGQVDGWYTADVIDAKFCDRPKENSLTGGRCSSSGLFGDTRVAMENAGFLKEEVCVQREPNFQSVPKDAAHAHLFKAGPTLLVEIADGEVCSAQPVDAETFRADVERLHVQGQMDSYFSFPGAHLIMVTDHEFDAIVAGLRLLAREVADGNVVYPHDEIDIGDIWTNGGEHEGLPAEDIHKLADRLLADRLLGG